jgi:hypothetical protein
MRGARYTAEFKAEAIWPLTERDILKSGIIAV